MNVHLITEKSRLGFLAVLLILLAAPALAKYSGGSGEPNDPYQIADVNDLLTLANDANDYNKCFIQTSDIDLDPNLPGRQVFTTAVIARDTYSENYDFDGNSFSGVFDGNGHKISSLAINADVNSNDFLGLFGDVNGGQVKNLMLENIQITWTGPLYFCGGLVAKLENATISNCSSNGNLASVGSKFSIRIGGLVGFNDSASIISNCSSSCSISVSNSSDIGILAGGNQGTINNCFSTNQVTAIGSMGIGGLVGGNSGLITNCHSQSTVIAREYLIGGLVGNHDNGNISDCFSDCNVVGLGDISELGGFVGSVYKGSIQRCYTTSSVSVVGDYCYNIGGFVGNMGDVSSPVITDCYSAGDIYAGNDTDPVGGFVGRLEGFTENCYSVSRINITSPSIPYLVGGFAGSFSDGGINHCYFLDSLGWNNGLGQSLSDSQMKQQSSFVSWNFTFIWHICENTNYPKLFWQILAADFVCPDGVSFADYSFFAQRWLDTNCASNNDCDGTDFDLSGTVDLYDLAAFVQNWLEGL